MGVDSVVRADDPAAEVTDTYISAEVAFEAAITDRITAFGGLSLDSVTDAEDDRAFEDMGLYVSELGLRFSFGETLVSVGKISPVFAVAWDEAPGFYGTSLAEDYELSEMIGVTVDTPVGAAGGTLPWVQRAARFLLPSFMRMTQPSATASARSEAAIPQPQAALGTLGN